MDVIKGVVAVVVVVGGGGGGRGGGCGGGVGGFDSTFFRFSENFSFLVMFSVAT